MLQIEAVKTGLVRILDKRDRKLILRLNSVTALTAYLSEMSSSFDITRIAVIIKLFLPMEPPNSITAILARFVR